MYAFSPGAGSSCAAATLHAPTRKINSAAHSRFIAALQMPSEAVSPALVEKLVGKIARRGRRVFEQTVRVVPDLVVEREAAQERFSAHHPIIVEARGLDVLPGGEVKLGAHGTRIFRAQPVKNALIGRA